MVKYLFLIALLQNTLCWTQQITWDCTKLDQSSFKASVHNSSFGIFSLGYSYTEIYTNEKISKYQSFEKLSTLQQQLDLAIPTEVNISLTGMPNKLNFKLLLEPGETITIQILSNKASDNHSHPTFESYKGAYKFLGKNAAAHQAHSFLSMRMYDYENNSSIFQNILNENWKEHWNYQDDQSKLFKQFSEGLDRDLIWLAQFVQENKLGSDFEQIWKEICIAKWLEKTLLAADVEESEQEFAHHFYTKFGQSHFKTPFTPGSIKFMSTILNFWSDNSMEIRVPLTTILWFLEMKEPKGEWEEIYEEYSVLFRDTAVNREHYFRTLAENQPERYQKIAMPLREARSLAGNFHQFLAYIEKVKAINVPDDYKLIYLLKELQQKKSDKYIQDEQLLDSLFTSLPSFSNREKTIAGVYAAYEKMNSTRKSMPIYDNQNVYIPYLNSDTEIQQLIDKEKGKVVLLFMAGHNGNHEFRVEQLGSIASYIETRFPGQVTCVMLTVDKGRSSRVEHSMNFAKTFQKYNLKHIYVVDGNTNTFWQDVYKDTKPCIVRMYSEEGIQKDLGRVINNIPATSLVELVEKELKTP